MISIRAVAMTLIIINPLIVGCTHVQPWERGHLAKKQMSLDPHPRQSALRAHNYGSREAAASSSSSSGGGGCGCY